MSNDLTVSVDREELLFTGSGNAWWIASTGGPDLSTMNDRQRAVLRALLELAIKRLDRAEHEIATGMVRVGGESGVQ